MRVCRLVRRLNRINRPMKAPPTTAVRPAPTGSALKLPAGDLSASLSEFEGTPESRKLSALEADADLVYQLMWRQYSGPGWDAFADVLARYGYQVVLSWLRKNVLIMKCLEKGIRAPRLRRHRR